MVELKVLDTRSLDGFLVASVLVLIRGSFELCHRLSPLSVFCGLRCLHKHAAKLC
jgi:hypothetical protein